MFLHVLPGKVQSDLLQLLIWEEYGFRTTVPQGTSSLTYTCEVSVMALVGGQIQLPKGTELISTVCVISVSKPLLKPVKLEIQHCADLVTQEQTRYLSFATASITRILYHFQLEEGGLFFS